MKSCQVREIAGSTVHFADGTSQEFRVTNFAVLEFRVLEFRFLKFGV